MVKYKHWYFVNLEFCKRKVLKFISFVKGANIRRISTLYCTYFEECFLSIFINKCYVRHFYKKITITYMPLIKCWYSYGMLFLIIHIFFLKKNDVISSFKNMIYETFDPFFQKMVCKKNYVCKTFQNNVSKQMTFEEH